MEKIEISYHLIEEHTIKQIVNITKEEFEERMVNLYLNHAKFIVIPEENVYIPISSIIFIHVREMKNGNN